MADVTGPVSTLPNTRTTPPEGMMCDNHQDRPAVRRVQGETDSFGAEYLDLCQECLGELEKYEAESRVGQCDWCGKHATDLRPHRDFEEGAAGRVYNVCGDCVHKETEALLAGYDKCHYHPSDFDDW